jgi:23S rRNA (cytosine1962-C5)-methyltransferase
VTARGAERWTRGHPWIYRSDVLAVPESAGLVSVYDPRDKFVGQALYSPRSEIQLRLLERTERPVDATWWCNQVAACLGRRAGIDATAYRVVHAEGDGLPSLIIDRYDRWVVAQLLSAGLETMRGDIIAAIADVLQPEGILLRHDNSTRQREELPAGIELVMGAVPEAIDVREGRVHYFAAPWTGQKTGAFLDQRPNRMLLGAVARAGGRGLDCFAYHGSFALHLAPRCSSVVALDSSAEALQRGRQNASLNGFSNIDWMQGDAFDVLRAFDRARERFDSIALDPPAFAKSRSSVPQALKGYAEINRRAMRLLAPGGVLVTASCSHHVRRADFLDMLVSAAADSGRPLILEQVLGQGADHPDRLAVPETGYLKGALIRAA